jgi:hypothetical protein
VLTILILITSAILLDRLNAAVQPTPSRDPVSMDTLARTKEALIAWSATHPNTPGLLPFPDRNDDHLLATADAPARYDGASDCDVSGAIASTHLLGSFPFAGEQVGCTAGANVAMSIDVDDSSGQRLWYAVSRNLVLGGDGGPINPDIGELGAHSWITVRDQTGAVVSNQVAAVIIAPGPALGGQDRSTTAPGAANYLDTLVIGAATYDNADADGCPDAAGCGTPGEEFIVSSNPQPGDIFNDRLVFITVDELMRAVEDRVVGEAASALKSYRSGNPGDYYPWMSAFSDPRSPQGVATGGSATSLADAGTDFVAASVSDGDLVRNLTDGSIGPVATGGVTVNTLTLEGLIGGTGNTFAAGDRYVVHAPGKFLGNAGSVEGMLPLHYPNEVFQTRFTVNWNFSGEKNDDIGGDPSLQPTVSDVDNFDGNDLTIPETQGACKWTQSDRVDCRGWAFLPGQGMGGSNRTVEVWFNFTADTTTIVAPTTTDVRRRNHTYNGNNDGWVTAVAAPDLPQETWSVRITDDDGVLPPGWRLAVRDLSTDLVINKFEGIRYEIGVPDELPAWFVDNNWHQFIHGAVSGAKVPFVAAISSGDGNCTTPPTGAGNEADDCLTIQFNATTVRDDVEALVIGPGSVLAAQNRNTTTGCAPQPDFLCDYFETPNSDIEATTRNLIYGRAPANTFEVGATFNDQIRAVPP